ncbi:MAG: LTA synthase family protein [Gammaproteobacteria bacterium]|nr:LTA synthase family protein [Gammaproteobacteria bacterium]
MPDKGWQALLHHWGKDFQLWLYISLLFQLFRLLLIAVYQDQIGTQGGAGSILTVMANGLRYDTSTAASWVLPTFLLSLGVTLLPISRALTTLRRFSAGLFAILSIIIFGVDLIFFSVYGDQLNHMIFGIAHDDTTAILITIWKEYHPILFLAIATPLALGNRWLIRRWLDYTPTFWRHMGERLETLPLRLLTGLVLFLVMAAAARGGTLWGQPLRLKHAFVVGDIFLNRTVLNPFTALRHTLETRLELEQGSALKHFWPKNDLHDALDVATGESHQGADPDNIDQQLSVTTPGYPAAKPRHIFVLLMESHSGWTVMPQYRFAGLSPELSALADEGIYFPNFLPSSGGTIGSLNAMVTGLPDVGLNINYEPTAQTPYPSALAAAMKRLGYTTRFFYGGFISWQRLDSFAMNQGFDEVYGGGSMKAGTQTNEWGVMDEFLFNYVLETVEDGAPSFNFILTTSNHPPYDLDLTGLGYHLQETLPEPLKATKNDTVKVLGHLWYADKQAGRFVRTAGERFPQSLFAITGDHAARLRVDFPGEDLLQHLAVPFILYGPGVLPPELGLRRTAGSHLDIAPTLIELAAEPGFRYSAFGRNMLAKRSPSYGYGWRYIIGENFIAPSDELQPILPIPGAEPSRQPSPLKAQQTRFNALNALSWYRVKKGPQLSPQKSIGVRQPPER